MLNDYQKPSSLRHKLKASICCFSSHNNVHANHEQLHHQDYSFKPRTPRMPKSPYAWLKKSMANESPDFRGRSARFIISRSGWRSHRHFHSVDFSYDPSSYALNFEDDTRLTDAEDFPLRNFSSRLPASPLSPHCPKERAVHGAQGNCWLQLICQSYFLNLNWGLQLYVPSKYFMGFFSFHIN
ncbi:Interleukin-2 receptor subunit beta like [Quillaja saponaria]|uniref:Interleukin-2 receptor subunit beta like n=1 Tax=Quillaja saponaria TaxID=32244 RepID=A0AAD7LI34_QUISA|nr:Interleukin-2 receptor subunit beta like [Quillaja saponaria]